MVLLKLVLNAHSDNIWAVKWLENNSIVSGSVDERISIWDGETYTLKKTYEGHKLGVVGISSALDGLISVSSLDNHVRLYDTKNNTQTNDFDFSISECYAAALSPNGRLLCVGSADGKIHVFDLGENNSTPDDILGNSKSGSVFVMTIAFSSSSELLAAGYSDGSVCIYDLNRSTIIHHLSPSSSSSSSSSSLSFSTSSFPTRSVSFLWGSSSDSLLISGSDDGFIYLWDVFNGILVGTGVGHSSAVRSVASSKDSLHFASGSADRTVKLWDIRSQECLKTFDTQNDQVWGVSYSPNCERIVSCSDDQSLAFYNVA